MLIRHYFRNAEIKDAIPSNSGLIFSFDNGTLLDARKGDLIDSKRVRVPLHQASDLKRFKKTTVRRATLRSHGFIISLSDRSAIRVKEGHIVTSGENGKTFDIELTPRVRFRERPIYLRDGV